MTQMCPLCILASLILHRPFFTVCCFLAINAGMSLLFASSCFAEAPMPPELIRMFVRIDKLSEHHDYDSALPIAEAAVKKYPNSYDARLKRGMIYTFAEEEEKAIEDFQWALKQRPKDWRPAEYLSVAYYHLSNNEMALKYIDLALALQPSEIQKAEHYMKKKDILKHLKRNQEAEMCAAEAVKRIGSPHFRLELMKLAAMNSNWKVAISEGDKILPVMPKFRVRILQVRAQALTGLKRYPEAEKLLNDLIRQNPDSRDLLLERIKLYTRLGQKSLADRDRKKIQELDESM